MSYMYDPRNRRPQGPGQRPGGAPTLDDYNALVKAYRELVANSEKAAKELGDKNSEIAIKDEALRVQGEDLKKTQSELLWTQAALQQAQKTIDDPDAEGWQQRFTHLQADVDNLRRRWEQRAAADTAEAQRSILRDMLPLADHLELALQHSNTLHGDAVRAFVGNIESTLRAFMDTLRRYGVERQDVAGKPFDPEKHEAIGEVSVEGLAPGQVAHVVQSGYMHGDRLLRPARVLVSR
jgi:molecular chaperone GrpE